MIAIDIRHRRGDFDLDVRLSSEARVLGLVGPSGSGKTTLINIMAGIIRPTEGHVSVDGRVFVDREAGVFVPPHRRKIGYVFQDGRLFPHLTVAQNLGYGRWFNRASQRNDTGGIVDLLGIGHLLSRRAVGLSGGERQRIAIGRALMAGPDLLLMDEPLAALDEARRGEILPFIETIRDEWRVPIVYVSHNMDEVRRLTDDHVTLKAGRVLGRHDAEGSTSAGNGPA